MADKLGIYTFPRCGRGWIALNLQELGMRVSFGREKDYKDWPVLVDHSGSPDKHPDRKAVTVVRDPVYSILSWHELNVERCDEPDTIEGFCHTVERGVQWWKRHVNKLLFDDRVLVLRYTDMLKDIAPSMCSICEHINYPFRAVPFSRARRVRKLEDHKFYSPSAVTKMIDRMQPEYDRAKERYGW